MQAEETWVTVIRFGKNNTGGLDAVLSCLVG